MVWTIAHRGASGNYPENTCKAFKGAIDEGADIIEFDVQPTKDKKIIVFHDRVLERTTNGTGTPQSLKLKEIKKLDAGKWFHEKFSGEKVPTLEEALECSKGKLTERIKLNIEIKFFEAKTNWFEKKVIETIEGNEKRVAYLAIKHPETFDRIKELSEIPCGLLQKRRKPEEVIDLCNKLEFDYVQIRAKWVNEEFIDKIHEIGCKVTVYYTDEPKKMIEWAKMGVEGILTNYPGKMKKRLEKEFQSKNK